MTEDRHVPRDNLTTSPDAPGLGVGVTRSGTSVTLTFYAQDEYTSIELYDKLVQSVQGGKLDLQLSINHPS
jgi:hypothetical protein